MKFYINKKNFDKDPDYLQYAPSSTSNGRKPMIVESGEVTVIGDLVEYVTPEAAEVRRQVKDIENDLLALRCDGLWYGRGGKHDVPKDACFVGNYGPCYVWVCRDGLAELSKLTITSLKFSGLLKDDSLLTVPGPRFTPASGFPSP